MLRPADAEEHLRVIRSLMERATIYRAISAQAALLGGLLSLLVGGFLWWRAPQTIAATQQTLIWLGVLVITGAGNFIFLWEDARRRRESFVSAGMKMALRALCPSFLAAGVATARWADRPEVLALIWSVSYALALLSTSHFAPRSIAYLGWAFLIASMACILASCARLDEWTSLSERAAFFNGYMALTFGLFHAAYALCTWPRRSAAGSPADPEIARTDSFQDSQ